MLKSQLLHILVLLIRYFQAPENENSRPALSRKKESLKAAVSFIEEHYKETVTLKDAAAAACMSPTYFSACFRQVFGENFKQYLNRLRLLNLTLYHFPNHKKPYIFRNKMNE